MKQRLTFPVFLLCMGVVVLFLSCSGSSGSSENTGTINPAIPTYMVIYDENGATSGSVPQDSTAYEEGQTVVVLGNTENLAKTGFAFAGWNIQEDGMGSAYSPGETFVMDSYDVTLYAWWKASGSLDDSFGSGGKVITPVGSSNDLRNAMALQNDGKILVAGCSLGSNQDFAVVRYNPDGTLDTGFGSGGKVITPVGSSDDFGRAMALQNDGKILVAGHSLGSNYDFAVVRYNPDGMLDTGFGSGGKVITPVGSSDDFGRAMALQNDGKILVAGYSSNGSNADFAVVRYNPGGTLDTGFGNGGKVITSVGSSNNRVHALALQNDGKILVAGCSLGSNQDFAVVRYNPDGTLDTGFGNGGNVITPVGSSNDRGYALALQNDGKILVAGYSYNGSNPDFAVVRYNPDGTLDTGFGSGGKVITPVGSSDDFGYAMALQNDGKILVAGYSSNGSNYDFAVVRYNPDGMLDTGFGSGGKVITPVSPSSDCGYVMALQNDGKILVAGYSSNGSNYDFAVIRLWP
ncbi:MAG: InlB B-repeat-containing protein [Spirochaetes bacterium]|nr:InlB B-repeat-containing protein [Spirochaetota bacterium]